MASFTPLDAVQAANMIANTVANIVDVAKRRQIQSMLALMSAEEQMQLARDIATQTNKNDQITILVNTVLNARNAAADRAARAQNVIVILVASVTLITLGILAWYYKKK